MNVNGVRRDSCVAIAIKDSLAALSRGVLSEAVASGDPGQALEQACFSIRFGEQRLSQVEGDIEAVRSFGKFVGSLRL